MSRAYSSEFDPPAILLTVTLSGVVHSRPRLTLPALIDTGADMTAVPETAVSRLRLFEVGRITVEDIGGRLSVMDIYTARLSVDSLGVQEIEVVQTAQPFIVLGRDWLQSYYLRLNGPKRQFEISAAPL
jgi:predicted aspartyl protease